MKNLSIRRFKEAACRLASIIFLLLIVASASLAQAPGGVGAPGRVNPKDETNDQVNREAKLRSAEIGAATDMRNQKQLIAAIEQTKNDFKRIQLLRNDIVDRLVAKQPLDYKLLGTQAEEINKRANRLKSFLMKPAAEDLKKGEEKKAEVPQVEYDEAGMKAALVKLCNTIHSFTGNPMFKNPEVVDAQQPAKAGGDLLVIIELSENIKKNADRLAVASK
ncbi:MAG: hypothetical protein QOH51_1819 [Acidobacteriota bacterium]|jgi:TolA-binding protein|nr:hypothetical protein [Acidobacteriota bacterium]